MEKTYFWTVEQAIDVDVDDLAQKAIGANATAEEVVDCFINGQEDDVYCTIDDETTAEIVKDVKTAISKQKEKQKTLLDKTEQKYLYTFLRPFEDVVVQKIPCEHCNYALKIKGKTISHKEFCITLPPFYKDAMYVGLRTNRKYSFKDLFPKKR